MTDLEINLLDSELKAKRKMWKNIFLCLVLVLAAVGAIFASAGVFEARGNSGGAVEKPGFFTQIKNLILSSDRLLRGEAEDRINVLLLGIGGEGHDGAYLSDTIIVASVKPSSRQIAVISIPRDLIAPIPGYGWRKINNADAFGELRQKGGGPLLAKEVTENVIGLPIHYYLRIDFEGFKKMIDEVGGIKVYVENEFVDTKFPTGDYKYRTISFKQGWQEMDGQTALDFARSRHGSNGEGNDFARSRRQQKVLIALKDNVFSFSTLFNPGRWQNLFEDLSRHLYSDLELWEISRFYKLAKRFDYENLITRVLTAGENGPLVESFFGGASILQPRTGDFEEIRRIAGDIFLKKAAPLSAAPAASQKAWPIIKIENGTWVLGLAVQIKAALEEKGLVISGVGNARKRDYKETIIYDFSSGRFAGALDELKAELGAEAAAVPPEELENGETPPDILVILGNDIVPGQ